jgi:hypothetical protein
MTIKRVALVSLLLCASAFGQWTETQKAWNSTAGNFPTPSNTTVSVTGVGAHHVLVAGVIYLGGVASFTMSVTDGNGHSFTQSPNSPCAYSGGQFVWLFYLLDSASGNLTITATPSVQHGLSVHVIEFTPPGTPSFDKDACAVPSSGTTPINTPSITPSASGVLYAAALADPASTGAITAAGGSWTLGTNGSIASDAGNSGDEYQIGATAATSVNWTVTGSSGSGWDAMAMSLTSSVAATPPNVEIRGKAELKGKVLLK